MEEEEAPGGFGWADEA